MLLEAVVAYLNQGRGVPLMFGVFLGIAVAMDYALKRTRWGRSMHAVGGNHEAARRAGIKVDAIYTSAFVLCASLAALGGVRRIPQIPSINFWGGPGGRTSERGPDSATPHARGILDEHGRVMVFITHNTDVGDAFEREGDSRAYFLEFSVEGYALGVNVLLYAMSH